MTLDITQKLYTEFHNDQFWVLYFSISIYVIRYTEDNTSYNFSFSLDNVISNLEKFTNSLLNWFRENHMKANADKCHLLVSSIESCTAKIEDLVLKIAPQKNC